MHLTYNEAFNKTKGTAFAELHYPHWVVALVLTLLAHGHLPAAIMVAFCIDKRTVQTWLAPKANGCKKNWPAPGGWNWAKCKQTNSGSNTKATPSGWVR